MNTPKNTLYAGLTIAVIVSFILLSSWKTADVGGSTEQDTTKKSADKKKTAKYSRKSIIIFDEKGEPHEELTESFEGDEDMRDLLKNNMHLDFNFPPMPDFGDIHFPDFPEMPSMVPGFPDLDTTDLKQFHLFDKNSEGFDEMMALRFGNLGGEFELDMQKMQEQLSKMDLELEHLNDMNLNLDDQLKQLDQLNDLNLDLNMNEDMERLNETLQRDLGNIDGQFPRDFHFNYWAESMKDFEKEAREELIQDGYLKSDERIESISIDDDEIKFNGITIKEEHATKYRDMQQKYMKRNSYRGKPE
jgi:bla regulator protein blaR1